MAADEAATDPPADADAVAPEGKEEEKKEPELPVDAKVALAEAAKAEGNDLLKQGDLAGAISKYAEGLALTEPILEKDSAEVGEEFSQRARTVQLALRLNSAQACLKSGDNEATAEHAEKALLLDKDNTKALYRRAMACLQFESAGRLEQARLDLARLVQLEPSNRDAREQLAKAKEKLRVAKQLERERYAKSMQGGGLYKEQHDKLNRQRLLYEEEVKRRTEAGEDEITFEKWCKDAKEKEEEKQKKAKEAREKAEKDAAREAEEQELADANAARKAQGLEEITIEQLREERFAAARKIDDVVHADDVDLDDEEKKLLSEAKQKGYYHGRLGTVLSSEAPKPQQVADQDAATAATSKANGLSEWNQAGTWEEKDASVWAKAELRKHLGAVSFTAPCNAAGAGGDPTTDEQGQVRVWIDEVKKLDGDAQMVSVRSKRRHGFNFDVELSFRITISTPEQAEASEKYKGLMTIPELTDFLDPKDWRIDTAWKGKRPPERWLPASVEWLEKLRGEIRNAIHLFLEEYKQK